MFKYLFIPILFLSSFCFSQNAIDFRSLQFEYYNILETEKDSLKAKEILKRQVKLVEKRNDSIPFLIAQLHLQKGHYHQVFYTGNDSLIVHHFGIAEKIFEKIKDTTWLIKTLNRYSYIPSHKIEYQKKMESAFLLAKIKNDSTEMFNALCNKAYNESLNGKHKESLVTLKKAETCISSKDYDRYFPILCMNYENIFNKMGAHDLALKYLEPYSEFAHQKNDTNMMMGVCHGIALNNHYLKKYSEAIDGYKKIIGYDFFKTVGAEQKIATYFNLSNSFNDSKQYDSAYKYTLLTSKEMKENHLHYNDNKINNLLGSIYLNKGQYKKAEERLNEGLIGAKKEAKLDEVAFSYLYLTELNFKTKKYNVAVSFADSALQYTYISGRNPIKPDLYRLLIELYDTTKNYDKKSQYLELLQHYEDSMLDLKKQIVIEESKLKHQNIELLYKNEHLNTKASLNEQEVSRLSKNQFIIIILCSIILIGFVMFFLFKSREHKKKLANWKLENEELKKELATAKKSKNQAHPIELSNTTELISKLKADNDWVSFYLDIEKVSGVNILELLQKDNNISKSDCKYLSLILLKLPNKDIAQILNITEEGVKKGKYRLRKKVKNHILIEPILN